MNALYITSQNMSDMSSGVNKKILMQASAFTRLGVNVEIPDLSAKTWKDKIIRRIPFLMNEFEKNLDDFLKKNNLSNIDFVYIRHPMASIQLLRQMKKIKSRNIQIVYEFPTFPYDKNSKKLSAKLSLLKDKYARDKLVKYVDVGVDYSGYSEIFGIPCLCLSNGIDTNAITPKLVHVRNDTIRFIGVALLTDWNGYDRLIDALVKYIKIFDSPKIEFHIVGNGDVYDKLKRQIERNNLTDIVFMHGFLCGEDLDRLYNLCDIGVGTLNPSRKYKNHIMSSLKTKEYAAKGMPFIKGDIDDAFDKNPQDFVYNVKDDESEIDLHAIIQWYIQLLGHYGEEKLALHIRDYAMRELSWDKQMNSVINCLENRGKHESSL